MIQQIKNEHLAIEMSTLGAELQSIKKSGKEYLWQGDDKIWPRRSPVLFPIVGALKGRSYFFNDLKYEMNQHGFARDQEFLINESKQDYASFSLKDNFLTRAIYPFSFCLTIDYQLIDNSLIVTYKVENYSKINDIYFSIGAHPAFNCPFNKQGKRSDYSLEFEFEETLKRQYLRNGLRVETTENSSEKRKSIIIDDNLFDDDALVYSGLKSKKVSLRHKERKILTMNFHEFPYLGIWSKSSMSEFICIEPWLGIADHQNHDQNFKEKEGLIRLQRNDLFVASYSIVFH